MARIHSKKYRAAQKATAKAEAQRQQLQEIHHKECPNCQSKNTALTVYGLVHIDAQLDPHIDKGFVTLGGCDLFEDNPQFH